jgi:WhiB family redox-sensing transcriptional regulator
MNVRMNWREDAACGDADPDLFFPIGATGNALRQIDEAKRICRFCPVQIQCLAWALENGVTDGVWGGATEDERRAIRSPSNCLVNFSIILIVTVVCSALACIAPPRQIRAGLPHSGQSGRRRDAEIN